MKIRLFTLPNLVTCLNLLAGCVGIVYAAHGWLYIAMLCVLLAATFDFLDGLTARLLGQYSPVGVQLDSLADVVSFGVLPAVMLFSVLEKLVLQLNLPPEAMYAVAFSPFLLTVFSALRLAKFNVDTRQTDNFLGLPTPANALFFASLALAHSKLSGYLPLEVSIYAVPALVLVFCFLLVSEIPMFSLRLKKLSLKHFVFVLLSAAAVLLAVEYELIEATFVAIILLYIMVSGVAGIAAAACKK